MQEINIHIIRLKPSQTLLQTHHEIISVKILAAFRQTVVRTALGHDNGRLSSSLQKLSNQYFAVPISIGVACIVSVDSLFP